MSEAHHLKAGQIQLATMGAWPGTEELVRAVIGESKYVPAWRPGRAGALRAYAEMQPRVWITADEFADWVRSQSAAGRKRRDAESPIDKLGMTSKRKLRLIRGDSEATKAEALACAHVAMNFPLPVQPGDVAGFATWVANTFGGVEKLSDWLGVKNTVIGDRMRGFDVVGAERRPREPEVGLIRALDWIARCGPFCPYGEPIVVKTWPGQA